MKVFKLYIFSDSKLGVNQVIEEFEVRGDKMAKYLAMAKNLLIEFKASKIEQVGRNLNSHGNALASFASVFYGKIGRTIVVNLISAPSHEASK